MDKAPYISAFVSYLGNKEVTSLRLSKEIRTLITELAETKDGKGLSQGEIIEAALYKAFSEGLLCGPTDLKRIRDKINAERAEKITKF